MHGCCCQLGKSSRVLLFGKLKNYKLMMKQNLKEKILTSKAVKVKPSKLCKLIICISEKCQLSIHRAHNSTPLPSISFCWIIFVCKHWQWQLRASDCSHSSMHPSLVLDETMISTKLIYSLCKWSWSTHCSTLLSAAIVYYPFSCSSSLSFGNDWHRKGNTDV